MVPSQHTLDAPFFLDLQSLLKRRANTASSARKPQHSTTRQCTLPSECYVWILLAKRGVMTKTCCFTVSVCSCRSELVSGTAAHCSADMRDEVSTNALLQMSRPPLKLAHLPALPQPIGGSRLGTTILGMGVNSVNHSFLLDECRYPTRSSLLKTCTAHP